MLVFACAAWLGKIWANRILESDRAKYAQELERLKSGYLFDADRYRTSLKKSEFIFQKEFEAATDLVALLKSVRPESNRPDMDWGDACDEIAWNFEKHEAAIEKYLAAHRAVLPDHIHERLVRALAWASDGKFHVGPRDNIDPQANSLASDLYEELQAAEREIIAVVRGQASTEIVKQS